MIHLVRQEKLVLGRMRLVGGVRRRELRVLKISQLVHLPMSLAERRVPTVEHHPELLNGVGRAPARLNGNVAEAGHLLLPFQMSPAIRESLCGLWSAFLGFLGVECTT